MSVKSIYMMAAMYSELTDYHTNDVYYGKSKFIPEKTGDKSFKKIRVSNKTKRKKRK